MEPLVLLLAAATLVVISYVVAALGRWRDGFEGRGRSPLRTVLSIAVAAAFVVFVLPGSAPPGAALDVGVGAVLTLLALPVLVVAATQWSRHRQRQTAATTVQRSDRPLVERSGSGRSATRSPQRSRRPPTGRGSRWQAVHDRAGREVFVYAIGAFDRRTGECRTVKIGVTTALERRLAQVQEQQAGRTEAVRYLGWGPGGERREKLLHRRLDPWRYPASEWYAPSPEVLGEVAKLARLTSDGRRLTDQTRRSA